MYNYTYVHVTTKKTYANLRLYMSLVSNQPSELLCCLEALGVVLCMSFHPIIVALKNSDTYKMKLNASIKNIINPGISCPSLTC